MRAQAKADGASPERAGTIVERQVGPIGLELRSAWRRLIGEIPGSPHSPTVLSRQMQVNRVIVSKLVNALARENVFAFLQQVPGPESLRTLASAAEGLGASREAMEHAREATERFGQLIRREFGSRGSLHAAIAPKGAELRRRVEHSSRYNVFLGMREIRGVEADASVTGMVFAPSAPDGEMLAVTSIQGVVGMRRLRTDVEVYFTSGPPSQWPERAGGLVGGAVEIADLLENEAASLDTREVNGQLVHRLAHSRIGKDEVVDMLSVSHAARGARRYATPERPRGGAVTFPDVPVRAMVFDVLLHADVFPGAEPELLVYNPGPRGPANPADRMRDIDLVQVPERIERVDSKATRWQVPEVERYEAILRRVCAAAGVDADATRHYRLRMQYPVSGFQYLMAFAAPARPA